MRRALDIAVALAGLALVAPLVAAAAVAVWLTDGASPFFRGLRAARGGGAFRMLKLRSMRPDAWKSRVNATAADDRRLTPLGRLLRRSKLDELPQLWNVLTGDMSLVGPRPQVLADAALFTAEERRLLNARPGITDPASIVFADEGDILAGSADPDLLYHRIIRPWKSRLSLAYLDHRGQLDGELRRLRLDLRVIGLTLLALVARRRALDLLAQLLEAWGSSGTLSEIARRRDPLLAAPPPGAARVVAKGDLRESGADAKAPEVLARAHDRQPGGRSGQDAGSREEASCL